MSNEQLKFWITCPNCKQAFGVEPRSILQYLNRVIDTRMNEKPESAGENRTEPMPTRPEGEPTPKPKAMPSGRQAPYKPPYRKWKR
jgi:hypothetical protein